MACCLTLVFPVCVATALVLLSASAHVTATEQRCNCDALKENFDDRLRELNAIVSDIARKSHRLGLLETANANVPRDIAKLQADVKALQDRGQVITSNLVHPVTGKSIDDMELEQTEAKILELAADVSATKAERASLRGVVEQMKQDIAVLTPDVQRALAALPKTVAKLERFYRAWDEIVQLLTS